MKRRISVTVGMALVWIFPAVVSAVTHFRYSYHECLDPQGAEKLQPSSEWTALMSLVAEGQWLKHKYSIITSHWSNWHRGFSLQGAALLNHNLWVHLHLQENIITDSATKVPVKLLHSQAKMQLNVFAFTVLMKIFRTVQDRCKQLGTICSFYIEHVFI